MSNTTNIADLVSKNASSSSPPNISMNIESKPDNAQNTLQNVNNVIQNEPLHLPSRDIPMNPNQLHSDPHIQQNYIPEAPRGAQANYLQEYERLEAMMNEKQKEVEKKDKLDTLLEDLQQPFMATLVFMIFALPIVNQKLRLIIPSLFLEDGNITLVGMIVKGVMFLVSLFILEKSIVYLAE